MHDTTDPAADHHDSTTDPTEAGLSVNYAAERLGITPDAVRARIRRGTLHAEKEDKVWTVYLLDTTRHDADRHQVGPSPRQTTTDPTVVHSTDLAPLVDLLADAMQRNADIMKQNADFAAAAAMWQTRAAFLDEQLRQLRAGGDVPDAPERVPDESHVETTEHPLRGALRASWIVSDGGSGESEHERADETGLHNVITSPEEI